MGARTVYSPSCTEFSISFFQALQSHEVIIAAVCTAIKPLLVPISNAVTRFINDEVRVKLDRPGWALMVSACISSLVELLQIKHTMDAKQKSAKSKSVLQFDEVADAVKKAFDFTLWLLSNNEPMKWGHCHYSEVANQSLHLLQLVFLHHSSWNDFLNLRTKFTGTWSILINMHHQLCMNGTVEFRNVQSTLLSSGSNLEQGKLLAVTENCMESLLGATDFEEMESAIDHLHNLTVSSRGV